MNEKHQIYLERNSKLSGTGLTLPSSKSESNRVLIMNALAGNTGLVTNISSARDTVTLQKLLHSKDHVLDVIDAGTTMRFLTAYLAITGQDRILTGTKRMCERPIGILIDALREIGARIDYMEREGFPPVHIKGITPSGKNKINMMGDVSSQFISAMLMIAPLIENGLTIVLTGRVGSVPYIKMTLGLMEKFGVSSYWDGNEISVRHQPYASCEYAIGPDWSAASYWYSMVAVAEEAEILLNGFEENSLQGDRVIREIMDPLGVESCFTEKGLLLKKKSHDHEFSYDFSDCPDLAQSVAVVCALKGINAEFTGLESLKIKETDRIAALRNELVKIKADLNEEAGSCWILRPGKQPFPPEITFSTYDDHRMAMAFAPVATLTDVRIENPDVVVKSYPTFWEDVREAGFKTSYI